MSAEKAAAVRIDLKELRAAVEQNRQDRLDYIDFKITWMKEHVFQDL